MKVIVKGKEYNYPTTMMNTKIKTRDKIKVYASQNNMSMLDFIDHLVDNYENKGN